MVSVILAAVAGFALGAVWYNLWSRHWIAASGIPVDASGRPVGGASPFIFGWAFLCILVVAGMMRHILVSSGVGTPVAGLVSGLGIGLFLIAPWITLNVLFAMRPLRLAAIDGGYAALACAAMGLVLTLF